MDVKRRDVLKGAAAVAATAATAGGAAIITSTPTYAQQLDAAKKWVDTEFQPSTLTKDEQMAEMEWFIKASAPFKGLKLSTAFSRITVKNVIDNLEGQAHRLSKRPQSGHLTVLCLGVKPSAHQACRDQRRRLRTVDILKHLCCRLHVLGFQVHHLPADHAFYCAGGVRDFFDDPHPRPGRALQPGQHFIGLRLQCVTGKNGDGIAENLVTGGAPTPQVVVVERRQVIVDQRISVQHLQRRAQLFDSGGPLGCDHAPSLHAKHRTQAFASGKHTVPHGLVNGNRFLRLCGDQAIEGRIGCRPAWFENLFEHEARSITCRCRELDVRLSPLAMCSVRNTL